MSLFSIIHTIVSLTLYLAATRSGVSSSLSVRTSRSTVGVHVGTHTCRCTAHTVVLNTVMGLCMNTYISIHIVRIWRMHTHTWNKTHKAKLSPISSSFILSLSISSTSLLSLSFPSPSSLLSNLLSLVLWDYSLPFSPSTNTCMIGTYSISTYTL